MSGGATDPGLTFFVPNPLPSDVKMSLFQTTDLTSWSEQTRRTGFAFGSLWAGSGASRVLETSGQSGRTITLRASAPTGARPKLFLQNKYEYSPPSGSD
jgi:hypothetical protein